MSAPATSMSPAGVVGDAFLGFDGSARWTQRLSGLVAAGSAIVGNTGTLQREFLPLL